MAKITCYKSGIEFTTTYLESVSLPHTAKYCHPVFSINSSTLQRLYTMHCKGKLSAIDSYLLFLSILDSSGHIIWRHPASRSAGSTSTIALVENNIKQLMGIVHKTKAILHPSFTQPKFTVTLDSSALDQIPNWIKAWEDNLTAFRVGRASEREAEELQKVENRLSFLILSGEKPENFAHVLADWADKAAEFPPETREHWKLIIRTCYNKHKMFNTPLADIKELSDYCACNIEAGSIHFHTLAETLREGVTGHIDYLGGIAKVSDYTLLPSVVSVAQKQQEQEQEAKNKELISKLTSEAPTSMPLAKDYPDSLSYLKARLAYRVAITKATKEKKEGI